ncbi:DUF6934 family protein [Mucilaginibacter sp.]|uniref:DUF6934 family protein n=1 Tax=Mucilaginibacter sp. TaxID=1882438 RepID=UPI00284FB8D9|nr:hypothetical protein [Mucilaginibacter sp.]MDR3697816.1 hypothetical protein [Mucilaginibacter sp.]
MDINRYDDIKFSTDFKTFSFISTGPKGNLVKVVQFIDFRHVQASHNLALGTRRGDVIDYNETTDNGDRDRILATIFHIATAFSHGYPDQRIFIRGRNQATTRLYRGTINHEYLNIIKEFIIYGGIYVENEGRYNFEQFISSKQYDAFLFERRQ